MVKSLSFHLITNRCSWSSLDTTGTLNGTSFCEQMRFSFFSFLFSNEHSRWVWLYRRELNPCCYVCWRVREPCWHRGLHQEPWMKIWQQYLCQKGTTGLWSDLGAGQWLILMFRSVTTMFLTWPVQFPVWEIELKWRVHKRGSWKICRDLALKRSLRFLGLCSRISLSIVGENRYVGKGRFHKMLEDCKTKSCQWFNFFGNFLLHLKVRVLSWFHCEVKLIMWGEKHYFRTFFFFFFKPVLYQACQQLCCWLYTVFVQWI